MDCKTTMIGIFAARQTRKTAAAMRPIEAVEHDPIAVAEVATA